MNNDTLKEIMAAAIGLFVLYTVVNFTSLGPPIRNLARVLDIFANPVVLVVVAVACGVAIFYSQSKQ